MITRDSQTVVACPYANRNTDEAMRFRITVGGNAAPANMVLCSIQFGSEYRYRTPDGSLVPFQPVVLVNPGQAAFYADNITSRGFQLVSAAGLAAMECVIVHDLFLNETANYAHVFLPGSTFLEKDDPPPTRCEGPEHGSQGR